MRKVFVVFLVVFSFSLSAFALELDQAKAQGIVGELNTGYLGYVVEKPTADVKALVEDINAKRKAFYQQTAVKTGATLEQVAATAYLKAVEKTETGNYYQNSSGNWQKK